MNQFYTGVSVFSGIDKSLIDTLYRESVIQLPDTLLYLREEQNKYIVLNDKILDTEGNIMAGGGSSVITSVKGDTLVRCHLTKETVISGISPRNKEQIMALDALINPAIKSVALTGTAGGGKTLTALGASLHCYDQKQYDKILLTKPMSQVGSYDLGILPGEVEDKFYPYLRNYLNNFEHLIDGRIKSIDHLIEHYSIEFLPFQLIRGASFHNTFVIADEVQILPFADVLTLGTRIGEGSKLVLMGDLNQKDEDIPEEKTGLYKLVNSKISQRSSLTASIHLIKNERSMLSRLFTEIFSD